MVDQLSKLYMSEQLDNLLLAQKRTDLAKERNSLANERTFLAWLRTGLGGMGGGVAIIRLLTFSDPTHKIIANYVGYFFIFWGILIFLLALLDYKKRKDSLGLKAGYASSNIFTSFLVGSLVVASLALFYIIFHGHSR